MHPLLSVLTGSSLRNSPSFVLSVFFFLILYVQPDLCMHQERLALLLDFVVDDVNSGPSCPEIPEI